MKAKRFLYVIIFLLSGVFAYANSDEIIYVLPDSLENRVVDQINTYNQKDNLLIYLFHREDKICLLISPYKRNDTSPLISVH